MNPSTIGSNDVERVAESHCDRTTLKNAIIAMLKRLSEFGKEVYILITGVDILPYTSPKGTGRK